MDNAVAVKNPNALADGGGFGARLAALPAKSKLSLALGLAALIGVVLAMTLWSSQGDYKVLYANLSDKDGGAIIAQLSQMNVPYKHADGGAAILVPASTVHDVRLKLASAGLPKGSVVGFELMDGARFGQTQFQERLTFQRGLEGELTRSIQAMAAVQSARVHLALPNQNGFFREQQKPSASVLLTLHPGRTLDRAVGRHAGAAGRHPGGGVEPAAGAGHGTADRPGPAAAGSARRGRHQQQPPRRRHQLRSRQDRARDPQRDRRRQAPQRRRRRQ